MCECLIISWKVWQLLREMFNLLSWGSRYELKEMFGVESLRLPPSLKENYMQEIKLVLCWEEKNRRKLPNGTFNIIPKIQYFISDIELPAG